MGSCCSSSVKDYLSHRPDGPLDHAVLVELPNPNRAQLSLQELAVERGGRELLRLEDVEEVRGPEGSKTQGNRFKFHNGALVLHELLFCWCPYPPSKPQGKGLTRSISTVTTSTQAAKTGMAVSVGYSMVEEMGLATLSCGRMVVRILARTEQDPTTQLELLLKTADGAAAATIAATVLQRWSTGYDSSLSPGARKGMMASTVPEEGSPVSPLSPVSPFQPINAGDHDTVSLWEQQQLLQVLEAAVQAYIWAKPYLHCSLRHRELFVHTTGNLPELSKLPLEEVVCTFDQILNFGAAEEDLVGTMLITNCRVIWALDSDRTTYNVSVPHRAHVPSLAETHTFGLCLVLSIRGPYVGSSDHAGSMRLGFGPAGLAGPERKARMEQVLKAIQDAQAQYKPRPLYGVADYVEHHRRYQVAARVKLLHSLSRLDVLSEVPRLPALERQLLGEVAECAICLEQVCHHPPLGYLLAAGRLGWACRHLFHLRCIKQLPQRRCPVCRATFSEVRELPDIRQNPGAWFDAMDVDRTGDLSREEVLGALSVVLPIDREKLETLLCPSHVSTCNNTECSSIPVEEEPDIRAPPDLWNQWDKTNCGRISRAEFEDPEGGLLVWILARLKLVHRSARPRPRLADAIGEEALAKWFEFWDWGQVSFLTTGQLARAVLQECGSLLPNTRPAEIVKEIFEEAQSPRAPSAASPYSGGSSGRRKNVPDLLHISEGICSRDDWLGGIGAALRDRLLEVRAEALAAGRPRHLSNELHKMFSFEAALEVAVTSNLEPKVFGPVVERSESSSKSPKGCFGRRGSKGSLQLPAERAGAMEVAIV